MHIITLDWETAWSSKDYTLSKLGPIEYIRDPRFHAQLLGVRVDDGPVQVFDSDQSIAAAVSALELYKPDRITVAHNGNGFDFLILSERFNVRPHWMLDTMLMMRWCGLSRVIPESHAALTAALCNGVKTAGTNISDGKRWPQDFTPAEREEFRQYCADDVLQCSKNFGKLMPHMTLDMVKFSTITARMATDPRFILDPQLLGKYIQDLDDKTEQACYELMRVFNFPDQYAFLAAIRSAPTFCHMLRLLGMEAPKKLSAAKTATRQAALKQQLNDLFLANQANPSEVVQQQITALVGILQDEEKYAVYTPALSKQDLDFVALQDHPDPRVALLVRTRLSQNSSIHRSRAQRFLELSQSGKPLPIMLNAFKAHTSRYTAGNSEGASDGIGTQNISKRNPEQALLRHGIKAPPGHKFVAGDLSQVEARMLAWLAGEQWLLNAFINKEDPYSQMAEKIFNIPWRDIRAGDKAGDPKMHMFRFVGKTGVLSCGYGVGWFKFSSTLLMAGFRLDKDIDKHHELAKDAHNIYRASNQNIVAFWKTCEHIISALAAGASGSFGGPNNNTFKYGMMDVMGYGPVHSISMPSGFIIRYPKLRVELGDTGKQEYFYDQQRGRNAIRTRLYGPKLTENLTQGLAFQLLQWQACRMFDNGVELTCNVHDSFGSICIDTDAPIVQSTMEHWMSQVPDWLPGFPCACEVEVGEDYSIA